MTYIHLHVSVSAIFITGKPYKNHFTINLAKYVLVYIQYIFSRNMRESWLKNMLIDGADFLFFAVYFLYSKTVFNMLIEKNTFNCVE